MPHIIDSDGGPPSQQNFIGGLQPTGVRLVRFPFIAEDLVNHFIRGSQDMFSAGPQWNDGLFQELCDEASRSSLRFGNCRPAIILTVSGDILFVVKAPNIVVEGPGWEELRSKVLTILNDRGVTGLGRSTIRVHLVQWVAS